MSEIKYYSDKSVAGVTGWHWINSDTGAWDGPKKDWEQHHSHMINKYCRQFRTAVQAGGNLGMYPRLLSSMFTRVYTFEPDPLNFKTLTLNCTNENIVKFQVAVGQDNDLCVVNRLNMNNVGMHRIVTDYDKKLAVIPVVVLDSFAFNDVDLIMLDIEQYEIYGLNGAKQTIIRNKPVVFVERPTEQINKFFADINYNFAGQSAMDGVFVPN